MGLRLRPRRARAEAGAVVPLHGDESGALTHPRLVRRTAPSDARAWAERGADPRVQAPGRAREAAALGGRSRSTLGVLDAPTRTALVHASPAKRGAASVASLERLDRTCGPAPGQARESVAPVLDDGPVHTGKASAEALADRPWITVEWPPR